MLKVGDNHCHLNPVAGMGVKAFARRFLSSGGWFVGLVNLLSWSYGVNVLSAGDYERVYRTTIAAANELRQEGLRVAVILGPHPAELVKLVERGLELEKATCVILDAYRIAAEYVARGEANGLGEVGRPHWRVGEHVIEACNDLLDEVIEIASELSCPVHFHVERGGRATIDDLARRVSGKRGRFVLHHAEGAFAGYASDRGLIPSVPARESELKAALTTTTRLVVESDFLDDPKRPGAVVAPWSIGRTFSRLISEGYLREERAWEILVTNVERLYDVRLE